MSDDKTAAPDAALNAEADAILEEFQGPPAPSETAAAPPAPDIPTGKLCGDLLDVTFNGLIAPRRGEHWGLSRDESAALGDAYGAVIDKYFPNLAGGPEVTALLLSMAVFGPRIAADTMARDASISDGQPVKDRPPAPVGEFKTDGA